MATTTHLVCAPDDLYSPAVIAEWLIAPGEQVEADIPLVRLVVSGASQLVLTPMAGLLIEHCIAIGEPLGSCDLLAMIEAEEPAIGMSMIADEDADDYLSIAACRQGYAPIESPPVVDQTRIDIEAPEVLALCAALGLSPDEIPKPQNGQLARADVERYVREQLRKLALLRDVLNRN